MDTTKTLTNEEVIKELLAMLQQNAMREQANDVFELCSYVDSLEKKIDAMTQEITNMQNEIKEMKEDSLESKAKQMLSDATGRLNTGYQSIRSSVQETKEQVKTTARSIVDEAKIKGKEALFRVSEFFGIKEKLLNGRKSVKERVCGQRIKALQRSRCLERDSVMRVTWLQIQFVPLQISRRLIIRRNRRSTLSQIRS